MCVCGSLETRASCRLAAARSSAHSPGALSLLPARTTARMRAECVGDDSRRHCDLILHEAGVPPIHTPMATLAGLPDDVKARAPTARLFDFVSRVH
jgi:hypothetical protein